MEFIMLADLPGSRETPAFTSRIDFRGDMRLFVW